MAKYTYCDSLLALIPFGTSSCVPDLLSGQVWLSGKVFDS